MIRTQHTCFGIFNLLGKEIYQVREVESGEGRPLIRISYLSLTGSIERCIIPVNKLRVPLSGNF